ncbi:MAG TPA: AbrB/MazE/SpoVT family DNA-binding domain-containing protein [Pyrinomonadaceae bacterium]|nr:AbrB/MazE/SpoVT family DNA-binding domain-containing protein [Pyrinomonadaceae bacterium]
MDVPPEMAKALGVEEGSVIVLYPRGGGMSYEILPPLPSDMRASVLQTCEEFKDAFAEVKRRGD